MGGVILNHLIITLQPLNIPERSKTHFIVGFISALTMADGTFFARQVDKSRVKVEGSDCPLLGDPGEGEDEAEIIYCVARRGWTTPL